MAFLGWFNGELRPDAWFDAELHPAAWWDTEIVDTTVGGGGNVNANLSVTDASDTLAGYALVTVGVALGLTETADTLSSGVSVAVVALLSATDSADSLSSTATVPAAGGVAADLSVTDASDTLSAAAAALVTTNLSATDAADTVAAAALVRIAIAAATTDSPDSLSSTATVVVAGSVVCTLGVTDEADTLLSGCTVDQPALPEQGHNGRDWSKFDVPTRRVQATLAVTDADDQLHSLVQVQVRQLVKRLVDLSADDTDDLITASASIYWVEPDLIRKHPVKLVSSRYEAAVP